MVAHAGDASGARILTLGLLSVDVPAATASFDGRALRLSRRHVELLAVLIANRNRVLSRVELSGALGFQRGRSIDVLLSGLRHEVGFPFVRNVPKRGWIIMPDVLQGPLPEVPLPEAPHDQGPGGSFPAH
jgi:DNA-binding response OmpR family regulator